MFNKQLALEAAKNSIAMLESQSESMTKLMPETTKPYISEFNKAWFGIARTNLELNSAIADFVINRTANNS